MEIIFNFFLSGESDDAILDGALIAILTLVLECDFSIEYIFTFRGHHTLLTLQGLRHISPLEAVGLADNLLLFYFDFLVRRKLMVDHRLDLQLLRVLDFKMIITAFGSVQSPVEVGVLMLVVAR